MRWHTNGNPSKDINTVWEWIIRVNSTHFFLSSPFVFITCHGNALALNTTFFIVFVSVKYKLNTDQGIQLTFAMTRRIYWDVYLILKKKIIWHLRHVIRLTGNQTRRTTVLLLHVFYLDLCSALTTHLSDWLSYIPAAQANVYWWPYLHMSGLTSAELYTRLNIIKVAFRPCDNCGISIRIFIIQLCASGIPSASIQLKMVLETYLRSLLLLVLNSSAGSTHH